jgi:ribonucleoside-diphosphate reductase alpha chain
VNLPEAVSVEDVEDVYIESWRLGLKAVALYRDNCKVGQPLSTQKKAGAGEQADAVSTEVERIVETVIVQQPVRQKLPRTRTSKTFSFRVADCHGYATVGEYEDGRPGEVFLKVAKQGSTLAGIMDAFSIAISIGLQYGVPLEAYVAKFINMKFEPSGMTNDPDIRFASSLVDYVFRRLALDHLPADKREALGIRSIDERREIAAAEAAEKIDAPAPTVTPPVAAEPIEPRERPQAQAADAPLCYSCGSKMQPAGSCYVCPSCGSTSGCS